MEVSISCDIFLAQQPWRQSFYIKKDTSTGPLAIMRSKMKEENLYPPSIFEPQSPRTKSQCATHELQLPLD